MSPSFSQALRLLIGLSGLCSVTNGFATPKADFLLNIDGGSVASSLYSICAIEQKQGEEIGGRAKCWGYNDDDESVVATTPADVSSVSLFSPCMFLSEYLSVSLYSSSLLLLRAL